MNPHLDYLQTLRTQAQNFWHDWQTQLPQWQNSDAQEIVQQSGELLAQYFPDIVFEMEGISDEHTRIVLSANGMPDAFPAAQALADNAPASLPHRVEALRMPLTPLPDNFAVGMGDFHLVVQDIAFRLGVWAEMPALEIAFTKTIEPEFAAHAQNMTMIVLDHLLGEYTGAVKIDAVDFVEHAEEDFVPLNQLPAQLNDLWMQLGRSGIYPQPEFEFATAEIEENEEQDALVLTRNQSANSLLGRADMAWCISVHCQITDDEDIEAAYDLEDAFTAYAQQNQQGIQTLAQMNLSQGRRTVFAMTSMPEILLQQALDLCEKFSHLHSSAECRYDPNWSHYRL